MSRLGKRLTTTFAPALAAGYIALLGATVRRRYVNREALARAREIGGSYIFAFWHARFVMMRYAYPDQRMVVLHSRHRDSRMLGQVMRRFGIEQAWGSTSEGGAAGARDLLRRIRSGCDVAIAPDGPRGPRRRVQPGVIGIARISGKAIVPVAFAARPARRLGSWDRTLLPLPFARAVFVYGDPVVVERAAGPAEVEIARRALEQTLDRLTDAADEAAGVPLEEPRPPVSPAAAAAGE